MCVHMGPNRSWGNITKGTVLCSQTCCTPLSLQCSYTTEPGDGKMIRARASRPKQLPNLQFNGACRQHRWERRISDTQGLIQQESACLVLWAGLLEDSLIQWCQRLDAAWCLMVSVSTYRTHPGGFGVIIKAVRHSLMLWQKHTAVLRRQAYTYT
eukprot:979417-Pelagomonas_calceolata.AAC.1